MVTRIIDTSLTLIALVIGGWAISASYASWRLTRQRRSAWQWGHLTMLIVFVVLTGYLIISLGSSILAAHV